MSDYTGPWCHTCNRPITPADELHAPDDEIDGAVVVLIGCARCLTFPTDTESEGT